MAEEPDDDTTTVAEVDTETAEAPTATKTPLTSNEERRAAAKRKLEEKLKRDAKQARLQRILLIAGSTVAVIAVVVGATLFVMKQMKDDKHSTAASPSSSAAPTTTGQSAPMPAFQPGPSVGADCQYKPAEPKPDKPVKLPRTGKVPTDPAQISASMATNQGNIGLMLANNESPCTVNSFASLTSQHYFDNTKCHRLTTSTDLGVLQCGDPKATGQGGPGYEFANEYPTDQYPPNDPAAQQPVSYPRGTLAMANAGPGTNGSQFFLVYRDSVLPPQYTVFGKIQDDGLATLDKIAKAGVTGGGEDGAPTNEVTVKSILLD